MGDKMPNWLLQRAYLTPQRTALVFEGQAWSFGEMAQIVNEVAAKLSTNSLVEGDRAAVLMKNRPETVWVIHALQQIGVEAVLLNHRLTQKELTFQLEDSEVGTLIYDTNFHSVAKGMTCSSTNLKAFSIVEIMDSDKNQVEGKSEFTLHDVCSIMYTSGTTGNPKGVIQTYGNHWWSAIGSSLNLGLDTNDAWLCVVPVFHISGFSILMRSVIYGMPVYLMEHFDEKAANQLLTSGKITIMSAVAAMLNRMLAALGDKKYHPNFRCLLLGGGPAPRPLLEHCEGKCIPVFQTYGMTETASQIVTLSPEDSLNKIGSAGKPLFPAQLKIMIGNREAKAREQGEITVKGPNVTKGYLNRKSANMESFNDGWFSTGDLGYLDESGYLYVLDRRSDLIISGGENIYPAEIEEVLMAYDAVLEAGVTGIADPTWGQIPYGFVVVKDAVTEEELLRFCKDKLASYKIPKRIFQIESLPRNGANKLMRRHLKNYIPDE